MPLLSVKDLAFRYAGFGLEGINAEAEASQIISVLGPNGAGKSTLLDLLAGFKTPHEGECLLQDQSLRMLSRERASRIAAHVPQSIPSEIPFLVEDVVMTGRLPHSSGLFESPEDEAALENALARVGLESMRRRVFSTLSGGEKQRVLLAAAICQQTPILLLDEPNAHLDPENDVLLWELMKELRLCGCLIIIATHKLSLAAQYSDRIWLMNLGRLVIDRDLKLGLPLGEMREVFRVAFHLYKTEDGQTFLNYGLNSGLQYGR